MYTLKDITRPSGGFAMLAVDQREAMRLMFAAAGAPVPVTDQHLTDFKVNAAKILSPYASAILVDQQFCYRQIVEQQAVAHYPQGIRQSVGMSGGCVGPQEDRLLDHKEGQDEEVKPQKIKQTLFHGKWYFS